MDTANDNFAYNNSNLDLFTALMDIIITYSVEFWRTSSHSVRRLLDNLQITELIDAAGDKLAEHPVLGFAVLAMALSCAVPVVVFIVFAIISLVFTFAGFIFVEGTLLAVGCMCLFGCLISMILVMSLMAVVLGTLYCAVMKIIQLVNSPNSIKLLSRYSLVPMLSHNEEEPSSTSVPDSHQD